MSAGGVGVAELGDPLVVAVGEGVVGPAGEVSEGVVVAAEGVQLGGVGGSAL